MSKKWELVEKVVSHARCTLLHGQPGTGKTLAAHNAALGGRQLISVTMTEETPAAELRGHYVPQGTQFVWQDGPALKAWRFGGRLVINEVDHAGGDALSFLLNCLDSPETACLTLPTGEMVRPHPQFTCVATMNGKPQDLPAALRDRFPICIEIDEPHPDGVKCLPADIQQAAACSIVEDDERRITLRAWKCFADLREKVGAEVAADAVFNHRGQDILNSLKIAKGVEA